MRFPENPKNSSCFKHRDCTDLKGLIDFEDSYLGAQMELEVFLGLAMSP